MATAAVMRPHDCLRNQFGARTLRSADANPRFNDTRSRRRKRNPADATRRSNHSTSPPSKALVMGQVKILKRGEEIKPIMFQKSCDTDLDLDLSSTDRLGPDPDTVQKQVRVPDLYAGVSAPPPSSLPFPTALVRRSVVESDLRKMLRI